MFIACCWSFFLMSLPVFYLKTEVWDQLLLASGKTWGNREGHRCHGAIDMTGGFKHVSPGVVGEMIQFGEHDFSRGLVQPPTIVNCWFGARWFGILRLIQILLVTFLGWLSDPCKCESRPPYTTLNHLVPDNHWGLVYSRGLGSPNHQSWDPMVLRTFGNKQKHARETKTEWSVFFWQSGHRNEIRNLTAKNHWLCLVALRQSNKDTVHSRRAQWTPRCCPVVGCGSPIVFPLPRGHGHLFNEPGKRKKHFKQRRPSNDGHPIFCCFFW